MRTPGLVRGTSLGLALSLVTAACGGDDEGPCVVGTPNGCDDGQVCELVEGGEPACFSPVLVSGRVFDLETGDGIAGARVVALDVSGAPKSSVVSSGDDGAYALPIPSSRAADGTPAATELTLRSDAAGFQTFPGGIRLAQPVDTAAAVQDDAGAWVVASAQTDVGLIALPDGAGSATIRGTVELIDGAAGVLVVAEVTGAGASAIADRDGAYAIFNLGAGDYQVTGYARDLSFEPASVALGTGDDATVDLALSGAPTSTVSGSLSIVNGGGGSGTSVILVVESTFSDKLVRGDSPPGLRTPAIGTTVSGAFDIEGVPDGRYVVLAAFEDDLLVRDPDSCISGTDLVHVEVAGGDVVLDQGFKITGALEIVSPGASGPEAVDGPPTFAWLDDSSEDSYLVTVIDSFGQEVWSTEVPGFSGDDPSVAYAGPALEAGMYYQFRVVSRKDNNDAGDPFCELSQTEDLAGVFFVP